MKNIFVAALIFVSVISHSQEEQLNIDLPKQSKDSTLIKNPDSSIALIKYIRERKMNFNSIYALWIGSENDWLFFQSNIQNFNNLEYLNLTHIKVDNFNFLMDLKKLKILELIENSDINFGSLVRNLNSNPSVTQLSVQNKKLHHLPEVLNELTYLKSLNIIGTKIKSLKLNLKLKYLELSYNRKLIPSKIDIDLVSIVSFEDNNFNSFPYQLQDSVNLEAMIFGIGDKFKLNCPINGFKNLKLLDVFSTNIIDIDNKCFPHSYHLRILQQVR